MHSQGAAFSPRKKTEQGLDTRSCPGASSSPGGNGAGVHADDQTGCVEQRCTERNRCVAIVEHAAGSVFQLNGHAGDPDIGVSQREQMRILT